MADEVIAVGLGEIKLSSSPGSVLVCYGLGSCVGVSLYDVRHRIAGLAHVVLPSSSIARATDMVGKFADTAIPALLEALVEMGAAKSAIEAKITGGAKMFSAPSLSNVLDVGSKNVVAVKEALKASGLTLVAEDCGGSYGRTMQVFVRDGRVRIRTIGKSEVEL